MVLRRIGKVSSELDLELRVTNICTNLELRPAYTHAIEPSIHSRPTIRGVSGRRPAPLTPLLVATARYPVPRISHKRHALTAVADGVT